MVQTVVLNQLFKISPLMGWSWFSFQFLAQMGLLWLSYKPLNRRVQIPNRDVSYDCSNLVTSADLGNTLSQQEYGMSKRKQPSLDRLCLYSTLRPT